MRCGSPASCVVCSSRVAKARGEWLAKIRQSALAKGQVLSMLTLTVRHNKEQALKTLVDAMEQAYTNMSSSRAYVELRKKYNAKFVRVTEVTHGEKNGWHPHFHIAIFHDQGAAFDTYKSEFYDMWSRHLVAQGLEAPSREIGVHVIAESTNEQWGWYLTKASGSASLEYTNGKYKIAKGENRGIWQVHSDAVGGDIRSKFLWQEYEQAMMRKRLISVSRGLEEAFGVSYLGDQEAANDETMDISAEDVIEDTLSNLSIADNLQYRLKFVGAISNTTWKRILFAKLHRQFREAIVQRPDDLQNWLDENGIFGRIITAQDISYRHAIKPEILKEIDIAMSQANFDHWGKLEGSIEIADLAPHIRRIQQKGELLVA